ncbi:MAG TPA: radical SAM protein [Mycobacteriales bacterium]|nr:radical SAM protein [Mycobacteriales bacterium]
MITPVAITTRSAADPRPPGDLRVGLIAYNWEADTSLALWNLINYARQDEVVAEHAHFEQYCKATPKSLSAEKEELFEALRWVRAGAFDVIGFSCYIWNIDFVNRLAQAIKEIQPDIRIIYGGQQIRGFYVEQVFERERCVDICAVNEAELSFQKLLASLLTGSPAISSIPGLAYWSRDDDPDEVYWFDGRGKLPRGYSFRTNGNAELVEDLDLIPSPYLSGSELPKGAAFLYEASRGCPYSCSFCIWGESKGVREYPMERVREEIQTILAHQPSHIMFCDGTFNMRRNRAADILDILVDHLRDGRVSPFSLLLELKLELIDDRLVQVLDELVRLNPLVTIEFGMQSSSAEAATLMRRPFREDKYRGAWNRLTPRLQSSAVVDCIYGLPGDGIEQFKASVDFAYSLSPHRMQCFRLSILPGSEFERQAETHSIKYAREPNHLVYETSWLDLDQMSWLEGFGYAVADLYHFHGTTIRCLLGLPESRELRFSGLITQFVDWTGRESIVGTSYQGNSPEGRWRGIDLTGLFERFLFDEVLPGLGIDDPGRLDRFRDIVAYESRLGRIAVRGLEATRRVRAEVVRARYDIPSFIIANRGRSAVSLADLAEGETCIALTVKAGHQDVHVPISYRIGDRTAQLLDRMRAGPTDRLPALDRRAEAKLIELGLLV